MRLAWYHDLRASGRIDAVAARQHYFGFMSEIFTDVAVLRIDVDPVAENPGLETSDAGNEVESSTSDICGPSIDRNRCIHGSLFADALCCACVEIGLRRVADRAQVSRGFALSFTYHVLVVHRFRLLTIR